ncbi:gliding motility-associated C-terminal domain-containing protein [Flavobacterium sp.]|uniref:T9SS type B sorting domain-containing protein n=1 Tax=Flavobacterium sp. TaxID=239 RepID=UPI0025D3DCC4|nr:gliding motility-associated C-terminal domain-containing protein [Flavobacterium sp.]
MKSKQHFFFFITLICFIFKTNGQNVGFYQQFNGRYDFTFIGNTMNLGENNITPGCEDLLVTSSSAVLNLNAGQQIEKAYLYWAGSGTGDLNVSLNTIAITSQITYQRTYNELVFFSAFADVTQQLITTGNGTYTLSDLDISQTLINNSGYCDSRTNFAGWAMLIIYEAASLPLTQINIYQGLQSVPDDLIINLSSLNVLDTSNSKVGFIAWEGDAALPTESFYFNNLLLSNAPLNPANNVFNGTNSITGSNILYNMDLDIYDIQGYIHVGDTAAQIKLTSTQDVILINAVVTKLNSQLPDATVTVNSVDKQCDSKTIVAHYTVSNLNGSNPLPALTPVSIYIDGVLFQTVVTTAAIPIGGSISSQITIVLPNTINSTFELKFVVDDIGNGTGIVTELNENNNTFLLNDALLLKPTFTALPNVIACNEGFTRGTFDFSSYEELVKTNPLDEVHFYETLENAIAAVSPILNTTNYVAITTPKEIFVRVENATCFATTSFLLTTRNCPPTVYNYVSANNDTINDVFFIAGLRNIFMSFKLEIYNRWGRLIWTGNQNTLDWDGYIKEGVGSKNAPDGTYFYLLFLNDADYPEPLKGFLYLNH